MHHYKETLAGNNVRMPQWTDSDLKEAYDEKKITRNELAVNVKKVLELLLEFD